MSGVTLMEKSTVKMLRVRRSSSKLVGSLDPLLILSMTRLQEQRLKSALCLLTMMFQLRLQYLSPMFNTIFPDSEIAKAYSCARTKTMCILNGAVAKSLCKPLIDLMKVEPFALATYRWFQ